MTKRILTLLILFFSANLLHSADLNTIPDAQGIDIHIDNITPRFYEQKGKILAKSDDFAAEKIKISENITLFGYKFFFAAPGKSVSVENEFFLYSDSFTRIPADSEFETVSTTYLGRQRGVHVFQLTIIPFRYNPEKSLTAPCESIAVRVDFNGGVEMSTAELPDRETAFFSHFINKEHINALLARADKGKRKIDRIQNKTGWYDPGMDYLKVATTKDGIARINISDALDIMPGFSGAETKYLHMLFRGKEYPIYIDDEDGTLDPDDKIFFYGRRASGDTTWWHNYTSEAVFYLYWDATSQGLRTDVYKAEMKQYPLIEQGRKKYHIEKEKLYNKGKYFDVTETRLAEGWYWDDISAFSDSKFEHLQYLMPAQIEGEKTKFSLKYYSMNDTVFIRDGNTTTTIIPENHIRMSVNGEPMAEKEFPRIETGRLETEIDNMDLNLGMNKIALESLPVEQAKKGIQSIDFIEIEGMFETIAWRGEADFIFDSDSEDRIAKIDGFSDSTVIGYDVNNHAINFPRSNDRNIFAFSIEKGSLPQVSLRLGDTIFYSESAGLHIAVNRQSADDEYRVFEDLSKENEIKNFVGSAKTGDYIVFAYNSDQNMSSSLRNFIADYASEDIHMTGNNIVWAYISEITGEQQSENAFEETADESLKTMMIILSGGAPNKSYAAFAFLPAETDVHYILNDETTIENARLSAVEKSDLTMADRTADAIIITHELFRPYAEQLAEHRNSQGTKTLVFDVENIYKEYNNGWKSPHAIKDFLKFAYNNWQGRPPAYLILFGDASWDPRQKIHYSIATDFVPSYGNPTSDYWYGLLDEEDGENLSEMITGRIPVVNVEEAAGYIDKIRAYDAAETSPWMKNFLLLTGGNPLENNEDDEFYDKNTTYYNTLLLPELCGDTTTIRKTDANVSGNENAHKIIKAIDHGAIWTNFLGHGAPSLIDMGGWQAHKLNNKGRYSVFSSQSCNTGAYAEPSLIHCFNETYVVEPEKGFIAAFGSTFVGKVGVDNDFLYKMYRSIARKDLSKRRLGDIMHYAKTLFGNYSLYLKTKNQYSLLGDPLIRLKISEEPDLFLHEPDIEMKNDEGGSVFDDNDAKINITGVVHNNGFEQESVVEVMLIRKYQQRTDTLRTFTEGVCLKEPFDFSLPVKDMAGKHYISMIIDPAEELADPDRENNKYETVIEVFRPGLLALDPQPYWPIDNEVPQVRVINPLGNENQYDYEFRIMDGRHQEIVRQSAESEIEVKESHIEWSGEASLEVGENYIILCRFYDNNDGTVSEWLEIPVYAGEVEEQAKWLIKDTTYLKMQNYAGFIAGAEESDQFLKIEKKQVPYKVIAVAGQKEPKVRRWSHIVEGERTITDSEFLRGFNVVVVPFDIDDDGIVYKRFDTYGADEDTLLRASRNLVNFLRDSVPDNAYLIIGTCDISFRQFMEQVPHMFPNGGHPGHIDTVKKVLHKFGSVLIDSASFDLSWAMMGWRGADTSEINETINHGDTAMISGNIIRYKHKGRLATDAAGPARSWQKAVFNGKFDTGNTTIIIHAISAGKANSDTLVTAVYDSDQVLEEMDIDLSDISAAKYPYIYFLMEFVRKEPLGESYITGLQVDYTPAGEFALLESQTRLDAESILRGENGTLSAAVKNPMYRIATEESRIMVNFTNSEGVEDKHFIDIEPIGPDEISESEYEFNTAELDEETIIEIDIDENHESNELYRFNNTGALNLYVFRDREDPTIEYTVGGIKIADGDFVSRRPEIIVELYDNSPLPVDDPENLKVRINGYVQEPENTNNFNFESFGSGSGLKARLTFVPQPLDYGEHKSNYMIVYGKDFNGNTDTVQIYMNVSRNGFISELKNYPNPFSNGTKFSFDFRGPDEEGEAVVRIYNINGRIVRTLRRQLNIGTNTLPWNGLDSEGTTLPAGVYSYRLDAEIGSFVEPVFGKLILVR